MMSHHCIEEVRWPVPPILRFVPDGDAASLVSPTGEYFVTEKWSDYTMRHPTNGRVMAMEVFNRDPQRGLRWLRGIED